MIRRTLSPLLCVFLLSACGGWTVNPLAPSPYFVVPSQTPVIWNATPTPPIFTATVGNTPTFTPIVGNTPTFAPIVVTSTPRVQTDTPISSATATPGNAELQIAIIGCNTSLDITHQMGEVTNAYVTISNPGEGNLTNACATLTASDEARRHPDKSQCIPSLPAGFQVTLKLTVDTGFKVDTSIQVDVTTNEGDATTLTRESCTEIGMPGPNPQFGIVQPIP